MSNPFFHFKQFSILYQDKGLKVTTDACLLGAIAGTDNDSLRILDIGTGTGVIALMLAQRFQKAEVTAIEIFETIAQNARKNFESSPFSSRLKLIHTDFLKHDFEDQFELIVCNPPYFKNHLQKQKSDNIEKNQAIHNLTLEEVDLCQKVASILSDSGIFWVIYPSELMNGFISASEVAGLNLQVRIAVYNEPEKPYREIIGLKKTYCGSIKTSSLNIRENGHYSDEYRQLMSEFYLEDTEKYKS